MLKINQLNKTNRCCLALHRFKSKKSEQNEYYKTLNLPNPGKFELSMKNICSNEEKIKQVLKETIFELMFL